MNKNTIITLVLITITIASFSQNLIKNPGFEEGEKSYNDCVYWNHDPNNKKASERFDNDCSFWNNAHPGYYLSSSFIGQFGSRYRSSDWYWYSMCPSYIPSPFLSNRCVRMVGLGVTGDDMYDEGIYSALINKLEVGKEYKLRIVMAVEGENNNATLHVWFTKWGEHWASTSNNNQRLINPITFNLNVRDNPDLFYMQWYSFEKTFTVPNGFDDLGNIVFFPSGGKVILDYVELTEYCPYEMRIENTEYYLKEPPYEAGYIYAGFDAGTPTPNGNVVVKDGADITYKAEYEVELLPGFEVEEGAKF